MSMPADCERGSEDLRLPVPPAGRSLEGPHIPGSGAALPAVAALCPGPQQGSHLRTRPTVDFRVETVHAASQLPREAEVNVVWDVLVCSSSRASWCGCLG